MTPDKNQSQEDIFDNREHMLKVWLDERRSRDNSADLMWENLKFFAALISGLITANTLFLGYIFDYSPSNDGLVILGYSLITLVLPISIMCLSWWGCRDLKRRWKRTLEAIAHLTNIEDLLGLREFLPPNSNVFSDDTHLFERYFRETEGFISAEEFIENKMTHGPNMYTAMRKVYWGLIGLGALLLAIPLYLVFYYAFISGSQ